MRFDQNLYRLGQVLICSWTLADGMVKLPLTGGFLDRALRRLVGDRTLTGSPWDGLYFADARTGLECVGLQEALDSSIRAWLMSACPPTYAVAHTSISRATAAAILRDAGVDPEQALAWGQALQRAVAEEMEEHRAFEEARGA